MRSGIVVSQPRHTRYSIGLKLFSYEEPTVPRPAACAPRIGYPSAKRGVVRTPDHAVTLLLVPSRSPSARTRYLGLGLVRVIPRLGLYKALKYVKPNI
jgi:hypothetical protein